MLDETLNPFLLGFGGKAEEQLQKLFLDRRHLQNLFSCTLVEGVKLLLEVKAENGEKLVQPRRAEACYGRNKQVVFERETGENKILLVREEKAPCVSNIPPTGSISWNEISTSLHEADIGLKLAGECGCPSLSLPTDYCPGLRILETCVMGPKHPLGKSPLKSGICGSCNGTFKDMKTLKKGKEYVWSLGKFNGVRVVQGEPIEAEPRPPATALIPHEMYTSDPFCTLCKRPAVPTPYLQTKAKCNMGENKNLPEFSGRFWTNSSDTGFGRNTIPSKVLPSAVTQLHNAILVQAGDVKLSPTPHCCEQCAGRALAVMTKSYEETLKAVIKAKVDGNKSVDIRGFFEKFVTFGAEAVKNALENGVFDTKEPIRIGEPGFAPNPVPLPENQTVFKVPKNYPEGRFRLVLMLQRLSGTNSASKQPWHWCYDMVAYVGRLIRSATGSPVIPGQLENGDPAKMIIDSEFWFDLRSFDISPMHRAPNNDKTDHRFLPGFPDVVNYVNYVCKKYPLCTPTIFINSPGDLTANIGMLFNALRLFKKPEVVHFVWINAGGTGGGLREEGTGTVSVNDLLTFISKRKDPYGEYEEEGEKMAARLLRSIYETRRELLRCATQNQRVATFENSSIAPRGFREIPIDEFKCAIVDYKGKRSESVKPNEEAPEEYFAKEDLGKVSRKGNFQSESKRNWSNPYKIRLTRE